MIQRAKHDLSIYRGDTSKHTFQLTDIQEDGSELPVDVTSFYITAQIRKREDDPEIWCNLPIIKDDPMNGIFSFTFTKEVSEGLLDPYLGGSSTGVWDLQLEDTQQNVFTPLVGTVQIVKDVSRIE